MSSDKRISNKIKQMQSSHEHKLYIYLHTVHFHPNCNRRDKSKIILYCPTREIQVCFFWSHLHQCQPFYWLESFCNPTYEHHLLLLVHNHWIRIMQRIELWGRLATAVKSHTECCSCQIRTENPFYNLQKQIVKSLPVWMSNDIIVHIQLMWSEFDINNTKTHSF